VVLPTLLVTPLQLPLWSAMPADNLLSSFAMSRVNAPVTLSASWATHGFRHVTLLIAC
jgi:hypothetical protein